MTTASSIQQTPMSETSATPRRMHADQRREILDQKTLIPKVGFGYKGCRLPPEIWSSIFLLTCSSCPTRFLDLGDHQRRTNVLRLTHVCRDWRFIAHSTAHLWTRIAFNPRADDSEMERDITIFYLERSSNAPLSIHIFSPPVFDTDSDSDSDSDDKYIHPRENDHIAQMQHNLCWWFSKLMNTTSRWKALTITTQTDWFEHFFSFFTCSRLLGNPKFPKLCSLQLQATDYQVWEISRPPRELDAFMGAPNLTRVTIHELPPSVSSLPLPLNQLRSLEISNPCTVSSTLQLLDACPALRHFRVAVEQYDDLAVGLPQVEHKALQSLVLTSAEGALNNLLSHLTLHSLRDLTLDTSDVWPSRAIEAFLSPLAGALRCLTVRAPHMDCGILIDCLRVIPGLEILAVERMCDSSIGALSPLFEQLTKGKSDPPVLLPSLQSLTLVYLVPLYCSWRNDPIDFRHFREMVLSRRASGLRIASLTLLDASWPGLAGSFKVYESLGPLSAAKKEGLEVEIIHKSFRQRHVEQSLL
ncbi:hypothetical protein Moror_7209 [Moniliophthora roreri MCA 2997]|uniref:F-box domain-containing protein n=2 Tax=Moniliophthora roreri TaxID=221103 RepID=V2YX02_MONRO|nr:hypothetical protein Moror_7209 [Moniliophthora roreri MCA 2997]